MEQKCRWAKEWKYVPKVGSELQAQMRIQTNSCFYLFFLSFFFLSVFIG